MVPRVRLGNGTVGFLMILPAMFLLLAMFVYPLIYSGFMSLHHFDLARPQDFRFVGLDNYVRTFGSGEFGQALLHTGIYTFVAVPIEFTIGLALALALANLRRGLGTVRTLLVIPMMLAPVAMALMWKFMYNDQLGIINFLIRRLGISSAPPLWLASPKIALFSVVLVDIWAATPWFVLLMLAGLASIPPEYYDAATIDGAGPVAVFRFITLPLLKQVIQVAILLRGMDAFRVFDLVYVMTKGGPAMSSDVLSFYAYRLAFTHRAIGDASATGWIMTLLLLLCGLLFIRVMSGRGERP
jgi:multiple sugar transport system permease protein